MNYLGLLSPLVALVTFLIFREQTVFAWCVVVLTFAALFREIDKSNRLPIEPPQEIKAP